MKLPKHLKNLKDASIECTNHLILNKSFDAKEAQLEVIKHIDENKALLTSRDNELAIASMKMVIMDLDPEDAAKDIIKNIFA